jgi:hypothetical protein
MLPLVVCVQFLCHFFTLSYSLSSLHFLGFYYSLQLITNLLLPFLLMCLLTHLPVFLHVP